MFYFFNFLDDDEHAWIVKTCRKGWDENVGYKPNTELKNISK